LEGENGGLAGLHLDLAGGQSAVLRAGRRAATLPFTWITYSGGSIGDTVGLSALAGLNTTWTMRGYHADR